MRALSSIDAFRRRTPTMAMAPPYSASANAIASETVPTNAATSADLRGGRRLAGRRRPVLLAVLHEHRVEWKAPSEP